MLFIKYCFYVFENQKKQDAPKGYVLCFIKFSSKTKYKYKH